MSSPGIRAALVELLLPKNYLVLVQVYQELKEREANSNSPRVKSLLMSSAEPMIFDQLQAPDMRKKVLEVCGNVCALQANLPFLRRSPDLAFNIFQSADFGVPIEYINIDLSGGTSIKIQYNIHQTLLSSENLGSEAEARAWAFKFLALIFKKRLDPVDIVFPDHTDEEWAELEKGYLEAVDKIINKATENRRSTYIRRVVGRSISFLKLSLREADLPYWKNLNVRAVNL